MRMIRFDDLTEAPWRNGGGVTRDIAEDRTGGALRWRLSLADVDRDGPFSDFAGLTRIMTPIAGNGLVLRGPATTTTARFAAPVTFDGAAAVTAQLVDGPIRNLNLMFDPARCEGAVRPLHGPLRRDLPAGGVTGVHCVRGGMGVNEQALAIGDTALSDGHLSLRLDEGAAAMLITLTDRGDDRS